MTIKTHNRKWIDNHCKIKHSPGSDFAYIDDVLVGVWLNSYMEKIVVGKRKLKVIPYNCSHYPFKCAKGKFWIPDWLVIQ